jgi:tRNA nucleotidyltransferase/poly(A) polymerase
MNKESPLEFFTEKPLRMLFYCRFVASGLGKTDWDTSRIMTEVAHKIKDESPKDIFQEVSKILMLQDPSEGLRLMDASGLMKILFPDIQAMIDFRPKGCKNVWLHTLQVIKSCPMDLETRWSAFFHDVAKPQTYMVLGGDVHFYGHENRGARIWLQVADMYGVEPKFIDDVYLMISEHMTPGLMAQSPCTDAGLRRFVSRANGLVDKMFDLSVADITSAHHEKVEIKKVACLALKKRIVDLLESDKQVVIKLPTGLGTKLVERLGLRGRAIGDVMRELNARLVRGELTVDSDFVVEAEKILKG